MAKIQKWIQKKIQSKIIETILCSGASLAIYSCDYVPEFFSNLVCRFKVFYYKQEIFLYYVSSESKNTSCVNVGLNC